MTENRLADCEGWHWPVSRRETGLVEHTCPHGIGHPNPGSALWIAEAHMIERRAKGDDGDQDDLESAWGTHGCDGCCGHESFPNYRSCLVKAHEIIREYKSMVESQQQALNFAKASMQHPWRYAWRRMRARLHSKFEQSSK